MNKKYIYKLLFKEQFMNKMLDAGWVPVKFKGLGYCIFERCLAEKYGCKFIVIDHGCKMDCERLRKLIEIRSNKQIRIIPLRDGYCELSMYYIIYEREKVEELGSELYKNNFSEENNGNKRIKKLILHIGVTVFYVSCYTIYLLLLLVQPTGHFLKSILFYTASIICVLIGGSRTITLIKEVLITKYIHSNHS